MRLTGLVFSVLIFVGFDPAFAGEWPIHSGDKQGTRYSSLNQITPGNVDDLELAWQYRTGEQQRRGDAVF